jgi:hypothetical protein
MKTTEHKDYHVEQLKKFSAWDWRDIDGAIAETMELPLHTVTYVRDLIGAPRPGWEDPTPPPAFKLTLNEGDCFDKLRALWDAIPSYSKRLESIQKMAIKIMMEGVDAKLKAQGLWQEKWNPPPEEPIKVRRGKKV